MAMIVARAAMRPAPSSWTANGSATQSNLLAGFPIMTCAPNFSACANPRAARSSPEMPVGNPM